jgi:hypothetical protein
MARFIFSVLAVTVFSALVLVGCSKEENDDDNIVNSVNVVNGPNEAWVFMINGDVGGIRLKPNHEAELLNYGSDGWWVYSFNMATWDKNGNNIIFTIRSDSEPAAGTYIIYVTDNNTLTEIVNGETITLTRSIIKWRNNNNDDNIVNGVNVVNGANEAWTGTTIYGWTTGMRFKPNHEVELLDYTADGWSVSSVTASWVKNGNNIILIVNSGGRSGNYTISVIDNNTLTVIENGETVTFTRNSINWR